jgi:hypothetical protein
MACCITPNAPMGGLTSNITVMIRRKGFLLGKERKGVGGYWMEKRRIASTGTTSHLLPLKLRPEAGSRAAKIRCRFACALSCGGGLG